MLDRNSFMDWYWQQMEWAGDGDDGDDGDLEVCESPGLRFLKS
ncbi:hypothetical protein [Lusitaniella coriacea]|nr:hypothetical protein [Lusitaniella coriacea]